MFEMNKHKQQILNELHQEDFSSCLFLFVCCCLEKGGLIPRILVKLCQKVNLKQQINVKRLGKGRKMLVQKSKTLAQS